MKRFSYNFRIMLDRFAFWRKFTKTPKAKVQECGQEEKKWGEGVWVIGDAIVNFDAMSPHLRSLVRRLQK